MAWRMKLRAAFRRTLFLLPLIFLFLSLIGLGAQAGDPTGAETGTAADLGCEDLESVAAALTCIAGKVGHHEIAINFVWTLVAGALVFFMQAGFAAVETGFCRARNAAHVIMTNFGIFFIGLLGWYIVGFALMFGGSQWPTLGGTAPLDGLFKLGEGWGLFGTKGFFLIGDTYDVGVAALWWFQLVFMDTAATIPTGAMAERWRFSAFIIYGFFISMFLYPLFGNWVWGGGWLSQIGTTLGLGHGYLDWAGSTVIHAVGGLVGLAGAIVLGARLGKYNRDGSPNPMPGHHIPMAIMGTFILWFGWFAFNAGSTLSANDLRISIIVVNTMLAGAAGAFTAMMTMKAKFGSYDPSMTANGALAGLVAITAPSAFVQPWSAVVIGIVAGFLVVGSVIFIERVLKVDDPVGAISVHGTCGLWGGLSLGLFADGKYGAGLNGIDGAVKGLFYGDPGQMVAQLVGVGSVIVWAFGVGFLFFKIQSKLMRIRVKPEEELAGVDIPEMGTLAYPDFLEAKGEVFTAPETGALWVAPLPTAPTAGNGREAEAGPILRVVRNPESSKPGAPLYFLEVEAAGIHAQLPVWRQPTPGDPYVKEIYRTELLGQSLERGNLPSLESAIRQGLTGIIHGGAAPTYLLKTGEGMTIPVFRQGRLLWASVQDRRLEGPDLAELRATVAEHLGLRGRGEAPELAVLALRPDDLRGVPPVFMFTYREIAVPVFARPWGALYAELAGQEMEAGPGLEGILALRREVARRLHDTGRLYDPADLAIDGLGLQTWSSWTAGLARAEEVAVSWGEPIPAYQFADATFGAITGPRGDVAVWFGRDRWDLSSRIEREARARALTMTTR